MDSYKGVKVIYETDLSLINALYAEGSLELTEFDGRLKLADQQNLYLILTTQQLDEDGEKLIQSPASIIVRVFGDKVWKIPISKDTIVGGVKPRNKEQAMALDALTDDRIKAVTLNKE